MSHRIALVIIAAAIALATAPAAAASENHISDPAQVPWMVVTNSFSH